MSDVEMKQAPLLAGWAIAGAAALVGAAVSMVVMDFNLTQAGFIAVLLLVVVGVILGLPRAEPAGSDLPEVVAAPASWMPAPLAAAPAMTPVPVAAMAPVAAAPAEVMAEPAPLMAAPLMAAPPAAAPVLARRPEPLAAARNGAPDDLKQIKGVGPVLEKLLHSLGYFHFDQVAAWTADEIAWVDENLEGFKGRVTRDDWVPQARTLAAGGTTEFSRRVEDGEVY